jgi:uncharacterized membrane protein
MTKNRLESFSDGVIAFAITLLVLEIRLPGNVPITTNAQMLRALSALIPNIAVYVISFLVCAVWWVSHHSFIHDLQQVNRPLLWSNLLFLLWIAFLPFPTALLGQHPDQPVAAAFYGIVGALTGASFFLMRLYASMHPQLMKSEIYKPERFRRVRLSLLSPVLYLGGSALSLMRPIVGILIYAAIPVYFALASLDGSRSPAESSSLGKVDERIARE